MSEPDPANPPSASVRLKAVRTEFDTLVEQYRDIAEPRITDGLAEYMRLVREHYVAVDTRNEEDRRRCRTLLESGRLCGDIGPRAPWDAGYCKPCVPLPIAAKMRATGVTSLDEEEAREVAMLCLEWLDLQESVTKSHNDRSVVNKLFQEWTRHNFRRGCTLRDRVTLKRRKLTPPLRGWERRLADDIARVQVETKKNAEAQGLKPTGLSEEALLSLCRYVEVEVDPRFPCSTHYIPRHPLQLGLWDLQRLDAKVGIGLCYARLAGLSDALAIPPRWTSIDRVTATDPTWFNREVDALLSLRPINWGSESLVLHLNDGELDAEFAKEMLRSVRADLLDAADWISSVEVTRICGFTPEQLQMAASRGKVASELRGAIRWYRRSHLRREYPKESVGII